MSRVPPTDDPDASTACALCGLPVPPDGPRGEDAFAGRSYCCSGCAHVDRIVAGLPEAQRAATIKALAERLGIAPLRTVGVGVGVGVGAGEPDALPPDPSTPTGVLVRERFRVTGMHCPSCSWLAERLLESRPGVSGARVDFLTETASADIDLRRTSREDAFAALEPAGYHTAPLGGVEQGDPERTVPRLVAAAIAAMNAMMLAWIHYAGFFGASTGSSRMWIGAVQAVIVVPAVGWAAAPIFRRAWSLLRRGRPGMETLLALGMLASTAISFAGFFLSAADFYFEIPAMIAVSALGSRLLERRIRRAGARGIADLVRPRALRVRLDPKPTDGALPPRLPTGNREPQDLQRPAELPDGRIRTAGFSPRPGVEDFVLVHDLRPGDRIVVPAGDEVPADVAVAGGPVAVSEAVLTGEATPVVRRTGAVVLSGSRVVDGELRGEVLRPADDSAHAQIGRHVLDLLAGGREGPRRADRVAAVFVPAIVLGALATALWHALAGGHGLGSAAAWLPAVSVLVVACPCAFSIAAAAALGAATLRLLRDGVLVGSPGALEAATNIDAVVFDKTGTLTAGDMDVRELVWFGDPQPELLPGVAALEAASRHPVGLALRRYLAEHGAAPPLDAKAEEVPGLGVRGTVAERRLAVGAPGLFDPPPTWTAPDDGATYVLFGKASSPAGAFRLDDSVRAGAAGAVADLRRHGIDVRLLSGDDPRVAARVAVAVGIERHEGRASPADKARRVATLRSSGRQVMYVGDGVNDAPALAAADVGLAMRHGAGMACEVAGFVAVADDPGAAPRVLEVARSLRRIVGQNYVWAVGYNAVLLPIAAAGWLHPALAALAMFLSSVSVLANSARLLRR